MTAAGWLCRPSVVRVAERPPDGREGRRYRHPPHSSYLVGGGQRPWRARLEQTSARTASPWRAHFEEPDQDGRWEWTCRAADDEQAAQTLFAEVETALDDLRPAPATAKVAAERPFAALGALYLATLVAGTLTVEPSFTRLFGRC